MARGVTYSLFDGLHHTLKWFAYFLGIYVCQYFYDGNNEFTTMLRTLNTCASL